MPNKNEELDKILSKIGYDHRSFANGDEWSEITGLTEAKQALQAYLDKRIKEAYKRGFDEGRLQQALRELER